MPLLIQGAPLSVVLAASGINTTVYVDSCDYTVTTRRFQRKEFSNAYLMNLPEKDGSEPIFVKNAVGKPVQINWNCGPYNTTRDVTPDDNNVDKILQDMIITTYDILGGPTSPSKLDVLFPVAVDHKIRLDSFDTYLELFSLKLSITYILNLQNYIFNYLTNTGLDVTGGELFTANNCLIRSFTPGILYTNPTLQTIVCKGWRLTLDVISAIQPAEIYKS